MQSFFLLYSGEVLDDDHGSVEDVEAHDNSELVNKVTEVSHHPGSSDGDVGKGANDGEDGEARRKLGGTATLEEEEKEKEKENNGQENHYCRYLCFSCL